MGERASGLAECISRKSSSATFLKSGEFGRGNHCTAFQVGLGDALPHLLEWETAPPASQSEHIMNEEKVFHP